MRVAEELSDDDEGGAARYRPGGEGVARALWVGLTTWCVSCR